MTNNAFKMISLAAVGTFSAAAMAVTAVAPRVAPVQPAPTMVTPNTVTNSATQFKAVDLKAANDDVAVANDNAAMTCNEEDMYNAAIKDTRTSYQSVKTSVQYGALNIAVGECGKPFNAMGPQAREAAEATAECVVRHDGKSMDKAGIERLHGECLLESKEALGLIQPSNDNREDAIKREMRNAKDVANTCGYLPLDKDAA